MYGKNYLSSIDSSNTTTASTSDTDSRETATNSPTEDEFKIDDDDFDFGDYLSIKRKLTSDTGNIEQEFDKSAKLSNNHKKRRFSNLTKNLNEARKFKSRDALNDSYDSSDEKPSRGTLDSIIPPPRDFFGSNNPFLNDSKSTASNIIRNMPSSSSDTSSLNNHYINGIRNNYYTNVNDIANKKLLSKFDKSKVRIVRTIKRRLSAKDIVIGPNMEIKRRKMKNRTGNIEVSKILF